MTGQYPLILAITGNEFWSLIHVPVKAKPVLSLREAIAAFLEIRSSEIILLVALCWGSRLSEQ